MLRYSRTYRTRLAELIGADAASAMAGCLRWTLPGLVLIVMCTPLVVLTNPGGSAVGLVAVLAVFIAGCASGMRVVAMNIRGAQLASAYLSSQWQRPVRIAGARLGVSWWR